MSRACRRMLTVWITMGIATAASAQDAFRVPVRDAVYEELEHFRALGAWSGGFDMRPVLRSEVLAVLDSLSARRATLDPVDRDRLDRLLDRTASWRRAPETAPARAGRPASYFEVGGGLQFFGGPSDLADVTLVSRRPRLESVYYGAVRAEVAERWTADLRIYGDYGRFTPRPNRHDWVDNLPTGLDRLTIDPSIRLDRAVIGYAGDWAEVRFGREDRRWGVGRRGGLFLTDNPFPLDGLSLRVRTGVFTATSLFAQSQRGPNPPSVIPGEPFPPDSSEADVPGDAYVAMHRIGVRLPFGLDVGFYEAVAYGGRGIDLGYANPIGLFLAVTQDIYDQSGTDDKKVAGLDVTWHAAPITLYGEFLLDRLVALDASKEKGDASGISSFAQLAGLVWANPLGLAGVDVEAEYAHLDPQVYFHHDRDIRRAFVRDDGLGREGRLLGHWLGPNADDAYAALHVRLGSSAGRVSAEVERARWGILDGQRGDDIGFFGLTKRDKRWITGDVATERLLRVSWRTWNRPLPLDTGVDVELSVAHVERTGPWTHADGVDRSGSGWQLEARVEWHFARSFEDR